MKATVQPRTNQNEVYTYVVLPLEALQQSSEQGGLQSLTVAQNVILKALPDGNITQQIQPITVPENVIVRTLSRGSKNNNIADQISNNVEREKPTQELAIMQEDNNRGMIRKSVILKSGVNKPIRNLDKKSEVRYLKCKASEINNSRLTRRTKESENGSFKCNICDQIFTRMMLYRTHMQAHRNAKKYKCDQCSASYNVEDNLKLHMAMHTKGEPVCPICNRKFQRLASLKAHIIIHEVDEIFMCTECLAEYDKEDDLNKHMQSHKKEKVQNNNDNLTLECSFCSHTFQDTNKYKEHISFHIKMRRLVMNGKKHKRKVNTSKEYPFKCEICKKSFAKYCLLERHMRIHSGEKPFTCHLCNRAFNQKGTLQIHLARHSGVKPFQCTLCPAKFCQKGNLRVHVQKTHIAPGPGENIYKCTMCTCIFKKVSSLNAHITRAHAGEKQDDDDISDVLEQLKQLEKRLETNDEGEITESSTVPTVSSKENNIPPELENNAVKYVRLVDTSVEGSIRRFLVKQRKVGDYQWYICSSCSKEFKKPSDLIRHIRVHTREKPYKCKYCDQAFSLKSTLTTHMTTHIGKRQHQCVLCLKAFTSVRSLNAHIRRHEKRTQNYMCSTCNTVYSTIGKAKLHMEMHEAESLNNELATAAELPGVLQQPMVETPNGLLQVAAPQSQVYSARVDLNNSRPHKCNYCNAAFTKGVHLKRHMLIHSGERKFKCNICLKSFYSSYALKEHLQFHSGERNFSCKVCGKKFVTNAILKRHLTTHNISTPYICPYCRKRFKTLMLCRRHIKIHKRDFAFHLQALSETGEVTNIDNTEEASPSFDLNGGLPDDNSYSAATLVDAAASNLDLSLQNLSTNIGIPTGLVVDDTSSSLSTTSMPESSKGLQQNISKVVYTDENGIIVSANLENPSQDGDSELQNVLGQTFFQATTVPQNFMDRTTNLALLSETSNELDNVEDAITTLAQENLTGDESICGSGGGGGPTVYINCEDLHAFTTASLYNACLAQLKNNDPLLMSGINEIQDPNILFSTDSTLNQITDTQLDTQAFEMLMPTFTLCNNMAVSSGLNTSFPNIILSNIEDYNDANQTVLPPINEITNKKSELNLLNNINNILCNNTKSSEIDDVQNMESTSNADVILNDDSLSGENAILSNLFYTNTTNQLDVVNSDLLSSDKTKICFDVNTCAESSVESNRNSGYKKVDFACSYCKETLKSMTDFKNHKCVEKTRSIRKGKRSRSQAFKGRQKTASKEVNKELTGGGISLLKSKNKLEHNTDNTDDSVLHSARTTDHVEYNCIHCDKVFATKSAYTRHVSIHKEKRVRTNNICSYCSKVFKKNSDLQRHIRTHTGEKPYSCDKCEKSFSLKSTLDSHYRTHNPSGNKDFNCAVCSSYFSSKSSLRVHMLVHTGVKPYQCTLCPEKFRTSGHRKSHMACHLKNTDSRKTSQSKTAKLNKLLASVGMDSQQNSVQETQGNVPMLNLTSTEISDKDNSELIMQDSDKDVLFTNQTIQVDPLLLQHLQLNNILLQDNVENLSFVQIDNGGDVQITNLNNSELNNFEESLYDETIVTEKTKPKGSLFFTKKATVPVNKEFICNVCNKKYSSKSVLTKHSKIHHRPGNSFKCTKCDTTAFDTVEDLDNHLKLHSGYRPYCCQLCANTFTQEKNLKTHMKRIHGILLQN